MFVAGIHWSNITLGVFTLIASGPVAVGIWRWYKGRGTRTRVANINLKIASIDATAVDLTNRVKDNTDRIVAMEAHQTKMLDGLFGVPAVKDNNGTVIQDETVGGLAIIHQIAAELPKNGIPASVKIEQIVRQIALLNEQNVAINAKLDSLLKSS